MQVLVTGSNGFIASSLIDRLLKDGHEVLGLDVVEMQNRPLGRNYVPLIGDITNPKVINEDYGAKWWSDVDFCFHLAAMANVDEVRDNREKAFQVNIHGTYNIVEVCRKYNIPLAFASTACCYGYTTQHPSMEDGPTVPVDLYGVTKRAGEELVKGLLKKYVILRFGTTFGPRMREALCTSIFLKQAMKKEKFTVHGSGEQSRNFIYVDDLVDGCVKAMLFNIFSGSSEIFNLVGEKSITILELASICYTIVNNRSPIYTNSHCTFLPCRPDDVMTEDISIEKAKLLLNWTPKVSVYNGMERIYQEWINNSHQKNWG